MKKLSLRDIIEARAKELGADGICNPDTECGCSLKDMCSGEPDLDECYLAKKKVCPPKISDGPYLLCPDREAGDCDCEYPSEADSYYFTLDMEAGR